MNKQDILNAFREYYEKSDDGFILYGENKAQFEEWLLNTLTEFEREVGGRAFEEGARMMEDVGRRESQLEKEKHPSK